MFLSFGSAPLINAEPAVGVLMPVNTFMRVDFPAPLGPMIAKISPFLTPNVNCLRVGLSAIYSFSRFLHNIGSYSSLFSILFLSSSISASSAYSCFLVFYRLKSEN